MSGQPSLAWNNLKDILDWDARSWAFILDFWRPWTEGIEGARVLDIGAHRGGLSLYFALKGCQVVCSDVIAPSATAVELHRAYGVADRVTYAAVDATRIGFSDGAFDFVCFKSVLGGIGRNDNVANQRRSVAEMHRVLRPGGRMLFGENLRATFVHKFMRRHCVSWGSQWRYLALSEVPDIFSPFQHVDTRCGGCLATFGRSESQRSFLHLADLLLNPILPDRCKYVLAGSALK